MKVFYFSRSTIREIKHCNVSAAACLKQLKRFTAVSALCFSVLFKVCDGWNKTAFYLCFISV